MNRYAYLTMVDAVNNCNKFYEMTENADGTIEAHYGRVGELHAKTHIYDPCDSNYKDFYTLYESKIRKGYRDVTAIRAVKEERVTNDYKPIENEEVAELIDTLKTASNQFVNKTYTIKKDQITPKMIKEAESDLEELVHIKEEWETNPLSYLNQESFVVNNFNRKLEELFADIPRAMNSVEEFTASSSKDFQRIIEREYDKLDTIRSMTASLVQTKSSPEETILEANGLKVNEVTYKQEDEITSHLGKDYQGKSVECRYVKAFSIENLKTRENYEGFKKSHNMDSKDCRLLYHGSKTENWLSIACQGLQLNPAAKVTGKMFGQGIYLAPDARKSANYMDTKGSHWNDGKNDKGYIAVYSVALGNPNGAKDGKGIYYPTSSLPYNFSSKDLPKGCISVFAQKGRTGLMNDEICVYNANQLTIKYLIELKPYSAHELNFNLDRKTIMNKMESGFDPPEVNPDGSIHIVLHLDKLDDKVSDSIKESIFWQGYLRKITEKGNKVDIYYKDSKDKYPEISINGYTANVTHDDRHFLGREAKKATVGINKTESDWRETIVSLQKEAIEEKDTQKQNKSQAREKKVETERVS